MKGDVRLFCVNCEEAIQMVEREWTEELSESLREHSKKGHHVIVQVYDDGWKEVAEHTTCPVCLTKFNVANELPDKLRGVISMIENGQFGVAIEHLTYAIRDLEVR